jgi:RNA polymerase sigma-70 factor, ECF subfamily
LTDHLTRNIDREEITRLKKGDFEAFDQLFEKYSQRIYHFAFGYLKSKEEAEEVLQDVFLKIWEKRYSLNEDLSFKAYLFTITYNSLKKTVLKTAKRENAYLDLRNEMDIFQNEPEDFFEFKQFQHTISELINRLPARRKQIFMMSRIDGKPNNQIADELSISLKTVENQISEAKVFLKENLTNYLPLLLFLAIFY